MSNRDNDRSQFENHQRATELQEGPSHSHRVGEETRGQQDHETGQEASRRRLEHTADAHPQTEQESHSTPMNAHGFPTFGHAEIAALAYQIWQARGGQPGSAEEDWLRAAQELRARSGARRGSSGDDWNS